jgi:2-keto-3-deoxy-L-rhamnonate aldolase RhmA/pimeloyl-ACP methyl ester carboxylesterase
VSRPPLAALLRQRAPLTALLAKMPCAAQVESAGHVGFDLVILDTEHGPAGSLELEHHLRAAEAVGLPVLVRLPSADPAPILTALDAGASGVVVPHVLDASAAEAAVAAAHYPPRGRRGVATSTRAGGYGAVELQEHLRRARAETCVVVQIEDSEAVPRAAEILAVPDISAVLIGVTDLSVSLGHPGASSQPEVETAVDAIVAAAARADVAVIAVADSAAAAAAWRARGASAIASVSTALIHAALARAARDTGANAPEAEREPLVLLPGMLGTADLWEEVAPALVERSLVRIGRIDLDDSVPEMAESLLAAGPPRFALAGHSLGGIVALEVVRRAPERVTRVALLNANARPASEAQLEAWATFEERTNAGEFAALAREFAVANLSPHRRSESELVDRVESMALAVGPAAFLRQLAAQRTRPDLRPTLPQVSVPALVLTGTQDEIAPRDAQEELAAGMRGCEHVMVAAAGHMAPLEAPAAVAEHLLTWLER